MLKKLFLLGASLALVLTAGTVAQAAGIATTAHDLVSAQGGGACAVCHLPHAAGSQRLWVQGLTRQARQVGDVSLLCAFCHYPGYPGSTTYGTDPTSFTWVFGTNSHGVMMSQTVLPKDTVASGLPYHAPARLGHIECTSCHDVHNNDAGRNPFLRKTIGNLCAACHGQRQWNGTLWVEGSAAITGTLGAWGGIADMHLANPGSHPVGTDITGAYMNTGAPVTIFRNMRVGFAASRMKWSLGGHLQNANGTGGVLCVSCHAVHGHKADTTRVAAGGVAVNALVADDRAPDVNMLAIPQAANGPLDGGARSIANGWGGRSQLCQGCHIGGTIANSNYGVTVSTTTQVWPNPGRTNYGHVVDGMRALLDWVPGTAWPVANLNWPIGGAAVAQSVSQPNVVCGSCHIMHPAANIVGGARYDVAVAPANAASSQYLLRAKAGTVCLGCHAGSMRRHHPVNKRYNTSGVPYLSGVRASAADTLQCGSCHSGSGAHNWRGRGAVGLDANWKPFDNGRKATVADEMFDTKASLTCIHCHLGMMGVVNGNKSPTLHANFDTSFAPAGITESYGFNGYATHVMGRFGAGTNYIRQTYPLATYWTNMGAKLPGSGSVAAGLTWPAAYYGGQAGFSRFGGLPTEPVLVCESCHELQPTRNATTHLLLGEYYEGPAGASAETRSSFCEGCHNPAGTHQMTDMTVTRTNALLNTQIDAVNRPWLRPPTDTQVILPTNNRLTCDSCHQPHDAATNTNTFIIDGANALFGTPNGTNTVAQAAYGSFVRAYWNTIQSGKGGDHADFCRQCHNY